MFVETSVFGVVIVVLVWIGGFVGIVYLSKKDTTSTEIVMVGIFALVIVIFVTTVLVGTHIGGKQQYLGKPILLTQLSSKTCYTIVVPDPGNGLTMVGIAEEKSKDSKDIRIVQGLQALPKGTVFKVTDEKLYICQSQ